MQSFLNAIFVAFAFGYDVAQILRCLDADTAGKLQAGEIIIKSVDDDGAPCEEVVEQAVFFWNEFAISYRRELPECKDWRGWNDTTILRRF